MSADRDQCQIDLNEVALMTQFRCDMFFVQQTTGTPFTLPVKMMLSIVPIWGRFEVYGTNLAVSCSMPVFTITPHDTLVPDNTNPDKKVFEVTVRVRAEGGTEVLAEATTWIYEKKE